MESGSGANGTDFCVCRQDVVEAALKNKEIEFSKEEKESISVFRLEDREMGKNYKIAIEIYFENKDLKYFLLDELRYFKYFRDRNKFGTEIGMFKYIRDFYEGFFEDKIDKYIDKIVEKFVEFLDDLLKEENEIEIFNVNDCSNILDDSESGTYRKINKKVYESIMECQVQDDFKPFGLIREPTDQQDEYKYSAYAIDSSEFNVKIYDRIKNDEKSILKYFYKHFKLESS